MNPVFRSFAIIPAAGRSSRMGRPKLLLPVDGEAMVARALRTWIDCVNRVVVVVRSDDTELADCCSAFDVELVRPETDPPDMKASVLCAVEYLNANHRPVPTDCWLLAPADMPRLSGRVIRTLLDRYAPASGRALVAEYGGRRGHPLLAPWSSTKLLRDLRSDQGVRDLLKTLPCDSVAVQDPGVVEDIDTPEDYARVAARRGLD